MSEDINKKSDYVINENNSHNLSNHETDLKKSSSVIESQRNAVVIEKSSRVYVILGWMCAALILFSSVYLSALFATGGVIFGALLNRQIRGSGNVLIISNIVLGIINIGLGILYIIVQRMVLGY
ncbi:MAG: hypothetical protein GX660_17035 [Clostridiaceae bacterium]|nr:hypothetical protein [Clostridiaceae bacterium]